MELSNKSLIESSTLVAEKSLVKWEGRYEYKIGNIDIPNSVYLYHTATGFTVDFYGTSLTVGFYHSQSNLYYDYKIDDETLPNKVTSRRFYLPDGESLSTVELASGLELGHHTITCLKVDEAKDAYSSVYKFETDGHFYYRNTVKDNSNKKFMFVCASGGSGYGALAYSTVSKTAISRTRANSSSLHSFNYLTARRFGADVQYVATSGWGVKFPTTKSILDVIDKVGVTTSNDVEGALTTGDWDPQKYVPDMIIFNIGGNDTENSAFDLATYKQGCVDLVSKLHGYYPNANMLWTHTSSYAGSYAISALTDAGYIGEGFIKEATIYKVGAGPTGQGTYGASSHYSLKTQIDSADRLTNFIVENYGYAIKQSAVTFNDYSSILQYS